jgi:hypothetical protein
MPTTEHPNSPAPPRAAAVAGVVFSLLMGTTLVIIRLAAPDHQTDPTQWLADPVRRNALRFAIQLAPFAGIAFLWFIGVLRNRLGSQEDKFFATVFLGSGLLFVASLFASAALAGALIEILADGGARLIHTDAYHLGRRVVGAALNVFAVKMAGVFLISTSTLILRTHILPRALALSGYACAIVLLLSITSWPWIALLFPLWILIVSAYILIADFQVAKSKSVAQVGQS